MGLPNDFREPDLVKKNRTISLTIGLPHEMVWGRSGDIHPTALPLDLGTSPAFGKSFGKVCDVSWRWVVICSDRSRNQT